MMALYNKFEPVQFTNSEVYFIITGIHFGKTQIHLLNFDNKLKINKK